MAERLQKIISGHGIASRRQAEKLLTEGRVTVNGKTAVLGDTAEDGVDQIAVDGVLLSAAPSRVYLMLHKPKGYVTTLQDEQGRKNVAELVRSCGQRVYPVGRLDLNSEGLLLMTNDGEFANRLMHPKGAVRKRYHVWINGYDEGVMKKLEASIVIDGRKTIPAKVKLCSLKGTTAMLEFVLSEGRNRQIRRLCEAAGVAVTRLKRIQEGTLTLGSLPVGQWRHLTEEEVERLMKEN